MTMFWIMGIVIFLAVVVLGVLFYFINQENSKSANGEAVPIMDITELKGLAVEQPQSEFKSKLMPLQTSESDLTQDELTQAKSKLANLEKETKLPLIQENFNLNPLNLSGDIPESDKTSTHQLRENVSNGPLLERIAELESQIALVTQKSVDQAEEAVKVIESLMKENAQLKMNQSTGSMAAQDVASLVELKEQNALLQNQLELSNAKVSQLESQVSLIKKELGQQLLEANSVIARLKVETESQERVTQEVLLKEKEQLEGLRQSSMRQLQLIEEDFVKAKEENLLLRDAKKLLEAKVSVIEDDYKQELTTAKELVQQLTNQRDEKGDQVSHLERDVAKLKELNGTLIDKAKILQYELNRYRAQASGLERVCANFKTQMEEMFGQVEIAKKENNRLIQDRINLESGFASLKSENVRLLERDKVYQQELEKTKEQINRFEKIYKNFKTDVGGVSEGEQ